jgi:23S rRNA (cytosine1962-C5)-methyltransferase
MSLDHVQGAVWLKQRRAKPVVQRHPWIFSGAIERVEGDPEPGAVVDVHDAGNNWLARGYINPRSQIRVRLLTWEAEEEIDGDFWRRRLAQALEARRERRRAGEGVAYRVAHAESDYLPGLVVDRYDDWLVVQLLTLGMDRRHEEIVAALVDLLSPRGIYERSDVDVRQKEGLSPRTGLLWGEEPPELVKIVEHDHPFLVDVRAGHKTGFYLDQRENRAALVPQCAGAEVLDAFAYTGAFGVHAAAGGARRVTLVDSSASALALARRNFARNGFEARGAWVEGDVFSVLRGYRAEGRSFDVVVVDPPKLAHSRREVDSAARAYKDVNLLAFQLLRPGGRLFTFSCSGAVSADLFQKIVFGAALDAGCRAQIVGRMTQGPDHPVALTFPEGAYLKGLIVRAVPNQ